MSRQTTGFSEVFEQAMDMFTGSFKAGLKFQEEMSKLWTGNINAAPAGTQDWQRRSQALWSDALPFAQRQADEYLKLFDNNYRAGVELAKKVADASRSESMSDAQAKAQQLLDESLDAIRNGSRAMAEANVRAMQNWAELVRNGIQAATEAARESMNCAAEQAKAAAEQARAAAESAQRQAQASAA